MVQKILVIRGGAKGDFILTLPLLRALQLNHPGAFVEILGYPETAQLAVRGGLAQSVSRVDSRLVAPIFSAEGGMSDKCGAYLSGFDLTVCVWPDRGGVMRRNLCAACAGRVVSIDPMPGEATGEHAVDCVNRQLAAAGYDRLTTVPRLSLCDEDRAWAESYRRSQGLGAAPALAVHPGSGGARKNWPARHFAETVREWTRRRRGGALVIEGPADQEAASDLRSLLEGVRVWSLREEPLWRVGAAIERCEGYLGNDSGVTHLAAAVGTPTVAVFIATDPALWAPRGPNVAILDRRSREARPAGALEALASLRAGGEEESR